MTVELALGIISVLWFFTITLLGALASVYNARIKAVEARTAEHEKRIQRGEDVHGNKIESVIQEMHDVKRDIKDVSTSMSALTEKFTALNTNVHKAKNEENALNATLTGINKTMLYLGDILEKMQEQK